MSGRHRKPTNTSARLAQVGTLTALVTLPMALTGTALASPLHAKNRHSSDRDEGASSSGYQPDSSARSGYQPDSSARSGHQLDESSDYSDDSDQDAPAFGHADYSAHHAVGRHARSLSDDPDDLPLLDQPSARRHSLGTQRNRHTEPSRWDAAPSVEAAKWDRLAQCESTQNWAANTGNGFKGGLQFTDSTWRAFGGSRYAYSANQASRAEQIAIARKVQRTQGWNAWPSCSHKLGYA